MKIFNIEKILTFGSTYNFIYISIFFFLAIIHLDAANETHPPITVAGRVINTEEEALIGATIMIKGSNRGTVTDIDGHFAIEVESHDILVVSYIGYISQEINVNQASPLTIILEMDATGIEEIVVTAYSSSNKREFTGSAERIDNATLKQTASAGFETALQGNVAGVNAFVTGQPGGSSNVQIRGIGSINGLTQPLYVLDGVVINTDVTSRIGGSGAVKFNNPLANINPDDIENITVLKDAAAASLYGSRAANGVIIITTKKGLNGETILSFNAEFGLTTNLTQEELISNQQFKDLWQEGQINQYIQNGENGEFKRVYADPNLYENYQKQALLDYQSIYGQVDLESDWLEAIYRTGEHKKYSLSARGGSEKTKFYISGDYLNQDGQIITTNFERYSGRLNLENQAKEWLRLGGNLSLAKTSRNSAQFDSDYAGGLNPLYMARVLPPAAAIYDEEGYEGIADLPNAIEKNANPIGILEVGKYQNNEFRVRGDVFAEISLFSDLSFKTTFGIDQQSNEESLYDNKEFGAGGGNWNGVLYVAQSSVNQFTSSNLLTYKKRLGHHSFSAILGMESQLSNMKSIRNAGYDVLDSDLLSSSSIGSLWSWTGYSENYSLLSYFSQFNYNYQQKYYATASFRRDGSSRFGKDSRWGDFWSVSLGWIASEENFFQSNAVDYLKFRTSYGSNGNLPPQFYAALAFFNSSGNGYDGSSGLTYGQLANPNLSWELSQNFNFGFDAVMFKKFNLTVEYFTKKTEDLLLNIPVSATTGFSNQLQNFGEMLNKGWEVEMGYYPIQKSNFSWKTSLNLTMLSNRVTKLKGDLLPSYSSSNGQHPQIIKEGESINSFYLRDYAGVNQSNGLAQYYVLVDGQRTGEITTDAQEAGFRIFGNAFQDVQGGFSNQWNYKSFSLDLLFTFGWGGEVYDRTAFKRDDDGFSPQYTNTVAQLNPWNPNNLDSEIPIRINGNSSFSNDVSNRHLYNADYIKLRNLKISYSLPDFLSFQNSTLYLQGNNLLLLTELDDYDPEAVSSGINFFQAPTALQVRLGLQLNL